MDQVAGDYREALAPAIDRVWADEVEAMRLDLKGWLQNLAEEGAAWTPTHAEFGFGFAAGAGRDEKSVPEPVAIDGRWLLHGVVDLIEAETGSPAAGALRVTDHKTGRNRTPTGSWSAAARCCNRCCTRWRWSRRCNDRWWSPALSSARSTATSPLVP